jgi:hypothetical protein
MWPVLLGGLLGAVPVGAQDLATQDPPGAGEQHDGIDPTMPEYERQATVDEIEGNDETLDREGESEEEDEGEGADRLRVVFRSSEFGDEVRLTAIGAHAATAPGVRNYWRCSIPCTLRVLGGSYRATFSGAGLDEELDLRSDTLIEAHGANIGELVIGVGSFVIGGAILAYALLTGEGACVDFDAKKCATGNGPLALGVGGFGVLAGIFLMLDSSGFVEITSF